MFTTSPLLSPLLFFLVPNVFALLPPSSFPLKVCPTSCVVDLPLSFHLGNPNRQSCEFYPVYKWGVFLATRWVHKKKSHLFLENSKLKRSVPVKVLGNLFWSYTADFRSYTNEFSISKCSFRWRHLPTQPRSVSIVCSHIWINTTHVVDALITIRERRRRTEL